MGVLQILLVLRGLELGLEPTDEQLYGRELPVMEDQVVRFDLDVLVLDVEVLGDVAQNEVLGDLWGEGDVVGDEIGVVLLLVDVDEGLLDVVNWLVHELLVLSDLGDLVVARLDVPLNDFIQGFIHLLVESEVLRDHVVGALHALSDVEMADVVGAEAELPGNVEMTEALGGGSDDEVSDLTLGEVLLGGGEADVLVLWVVDSPWNVP